MEIRKGKLEKIEVQNGIGKNGNQYKLYKYTINGKVYSNFNDFGLKIGDDVVFRGQQEGAFWRLDGMKLDDGTEEKLPEQELPKAVNEVIVEDVLRLILAEVSEIVRLLKTKSNT